MIERTSLDVTFADCQTRDSQLEIDLACSGSGIAALVARTESYEFEIDVALDC